VKNWKVVPICERQKLDIRRDDLLCDGDFRKCDVYRSGSGYDKFPYIYDRRFGKRLHNQFVVQLFGCPLDCFYCYVTPDGIWGDYKIYHSNELVKTFLNSGQEVFHLMGGAPGLYVEDWFDIVERLPERFVFHSDLLLIEKPYKKEYLRYINKNVLLAVDIKGTSPENFLQNTRRPFNSKLFWNNLDVVVNSGVSFYLTFTNPGKELVAFKATLAQRFGTSALKDSFVIDLIKYNACAVFPVYP